MNHLTEKLAEDYFETIEEAVCGCLSGFAEHGFVLLQASRVGYPRTKSYSAAFSFFNYQTAMEINFSFFPAHEGLNGGFISSIIKHGTRRLQLEDYLKLHGRSELTEFFSYRDEKKDIEEFAKAFLAMFLELLDTDLRTILDGTTFEETPIDWMGYK